jgi:uncharacterized protein YjbI with pentapeptide repeats
VTLVETTLRGADLRKADLAGVSLTSADIQDVTMTESDAEQAAESTETLRNHGVRITD